MCCAIAVCILASLAASSDGAVIFFTSRAAWENELINQGFVATTESFDGIDSDIQIGQDNRVFADSSIISMEFNGDGIGNDFTDGTTLISASSGDATMANTEGHSIAIRNAFFPDSMRAIGFNITFSSFPGFWEMWIATNGNPSQQQPFGNGVEIENGGGFAGWLALDGDVIDSVSILHLAVGGIPDSATFDNVSVVAIPEPGTSVVMGFGLACLLIRRRRPSSRSDNP